MKYKNLNICMNKKILILGGVLIVLIILAYAYQGPLKKWQNNLGKPKNILANIDVDKIDRIEITSTGNSVILSRINWAGSQLASIQPDKWKYNNSKDFYVDPAIMIKTLTSLDQAKTSELELVSNNAGRKSEFKIDDTGLTVKIYRGEKEIVNFIVGGRASNYDGSYISTSISPAVYLVKPDLRDAFEQTEWRDLTIFSNISAEIKKVRFQYPNREFTVERQDDKWTGVLPEKFTINKAKIDKIAQIMSDLKAVKIPEQTFTGTGLEKHLIIIEATSENIDNVLMIGDSQNGLSYAKRGESDNIYLIDKSDRDELDKWIWQLK